MFAAGGVLMALACGFLIIVPLTLTIGAVILRAACSTFNKIAGADRGVPEPGFWKAVGIVFGAGIISIILNVIVSFILNSGGVPAPGTEVRTVIIGQFVAFPIGLFVMAGMLTGLLPTSFGKSLLVSLAYKLIAILIAIVFVVVFSIAGVGLGVFGRG